MAFAAAGLLLCGITVSTPFLSVLLLGGAQASHVGSGAWAFLDEGLWMLSLMLLVTVVLVPLARLGLRVVVLGGLRQARPPRWLFLPLRWHEALTAWSMLEIFLLGALVSCIRLDAVADVHFGLAAYALGATVLATLVADAAFQSQAAWDALEECGAIAMPGHTPPSALGPSAVIACPCCRRLSPTVQGAPCARCGTPLHRRTPASLACTTALLLAAALLYLPANLLPVMIVTSLGQGGAHTILGGLAEFVQAGYWPLAVLGFLASVVVPLLKLVGLTILAWLTHRRSTWALPLRTRFYHLIKVTGRWSMVDVFVAAVLVALVRFGALASITAGAGAAFFGAVVILTMLATEAFDPRLMWDALDDGVAPLEGAR
ncbi:paraquat-inducible protein A [Nitrospirillum sp. BR 11752]|uniref:paraquat-inducible protein A n=1 Tax=Nitrospirillum sp. BR 11752 TaxID=3104293 RepID=UPI002EC6F56A|nr:paraquat-inducible protein A [Nitrospirillum sp. BR 11752]